MNKYTEIAEQLKREILAGKFEGDSRFPTGLQLAKRFGVSRPTINRVMYALRQDGLVVTRAGASPRLTRFAEHATGTLGVIHPGCQYGDVLSEICESLVRQGERFGWDIALREMVETDPKRRLREFVDAILNFSEERVAGLFLQPFACLGGVSSDQRRVEDELSRLGIPIVLLDYDPMRQDGRVVYDLVSMDNVAAGRTIGKCLLECGFRRLAFLRKAYFPPSSADRMLGVASAVVDAGHSWSEHENVLDCEPECRKKVSRFLKTRHPDAIVCENDATAVQLHMTLRALGVEGAVRLAGFDNQREARQLGIMSVAQPCEEIASIAIQTLLMRMRNPSLPVFTALVHDCGVVR